MEAEKTKTPTSKPKGRPPKSAAKPKVEAKSAEKQHLEVVQELKKFHKDDLIPCVSVFAGECTMIGRRTNTKYIWEEMGAETEVYFEDLQAEIMYKKSSYVYDPLIVIKDPDVYAGRKEIEDLYKKQIFSMDQLESLLKTDNTALIQKKIRAVPEGMIDSVKTMIATFVQDGTVTSYRAVKCVDDILGTDIAKQFELFH